MKILIKGFKKAINELKLLYIISFIVSILVIIPIYNFLLEKFKQEEKTCRNDWEQKSDKIILNNAGGYSDGVLINYIAE